jgi:formiminoglutamase
MHKPVEMSLWQGRIDNETGAERWHQKVIPLTPQAIDSGPPGIVLLGVCTDVGVERNLGRRGAKEGPDAIRAALAGLAWHLPVPCYDAGNLYCVGTDLEALQEEQAIWVARLLDLGHFPIVLGGGHEVALGTHLGLRQHLEGRDQRGIVGVLNFDAHFDLRAGEHSTSGTPFRQIAATAGETTFLFRYCCLGISEVANTAALFRTAESIQATWLLDEQLTPWNLPAVEERLARFLDACDVIHLSIDLDVLPAGTAPGVSAPSPRGVPLEMVEYLLRFIKRHAARKMTVAEIAECNPDFDIDHRTAKVAARLCHLIARKERD